MVVLCTQFTRALYTVYVAVCWRRRCVVPCSVHVSVARFVYHASLVVAQHLVVLVAVFL